MIRTIRNAHIKAGDCKMWRDEQMRTRNVCGRNTVARCMRHRGCRSCALVDKITGRLASCTSWTVAGIIVLYATRCYCSAYHTHDLNTHRHMYSCCCVVHCVSINMRRRSHSALALRLCRVFSSLCIGFMYNKWTNEWIYIFMHWLQSSTQWTVPLSQNHKIGLHYTSL